MMNFSFLSQRTDYVLFAPTCMEAEKILSTAPAMCAVGCRKALELAVKWVYAADKTMKMPYKDNLQSLIHEPSFRFAVDSNTWGKLPFIIKLGNLAVHTERSVRPSDALASLKGLFEFVQWIDYCYGSDYQERVFDERLIPTEKVAVEPQKIKEQESLLDEKDAEIEALRKQIAQMSAQYTADKEKHRQERSFQPEDLSEFQTRKIYIDVDLKFMGWKFDGTDADVQEEYPVQGMAGVVGQMGYCDYVLFGKDGLPLAVIEAKRTSKDPNIGRKQAVLYADCLERKFGRRPMMFTTNGFETYFWDDQSGPQRKVSGVFSKEDLKKLMNRRAERQDPVASEELPGTRLRVQPHLAERTRLHPDGRDGVPHGRPVVRRLCRGRCRSHHRIHRPENRSGLGEARHADGVAPHIGHSAQHQWQDPRRTSFQQHVWRECNACEPFWYGFVCRT